MCLKGLIYLKKTYVKGVICNFYNILFLDLKLVFNVYKIFPNLTQILTQIILFFF